MTQKNEMSARALKMEELEMVNGGAPAAAPAPRGRGMLVARGRNRGIFV
jgi:hypothetical protein